MKNDNLTDIAPLVVGDTSPVSTNRISPIQFIQINSNNILDLDEK